MSLNFFTPEQGLNSLLAPASIGGKKDYTTSLKKNEFATSNSSNDAVDSENNKKFAEMMNALKKKESSHNKKEDNKADKKDNTSSEKITSRFSDEKVRVEAFYTAQNALAADLNNIEPEANNDMSQVNLVNIEMLSAEIQKLIKEQTNGKDGIETKILVDSAAQPEKIESIIALLSSFLDNNKEGEETADIVALLEKVEDFASSDEAAAITLGLSPEQLTELQEHIQQYISDELNERDTKALEALAAQFVELTPPKQQSDAAKQNIEKSSLTAISEETTQPLPAKHHSQDRYDNKYDARYDSRYNNSGEAAPTDVETDNPEFKAELKDTLPKAPVSNDNTQNAAQRLAHVATQVQGAPLTFDTNGSQQGSGLVNALQTSSSALHNSATNIITQSQNAGAPHPATQMVSATIQRAVKAGDDTNIKLKLDPPELGRVEVKMSIDKDNATKVVLTIEKPETYTLLKQDSEALQRALNNAGLDAEGNLSFELADEGHDFNNDREDSNNRGHANGKFPGGDSEEIIETTMDWQVDPDTGHMRYSTLV